MNSLWFYFDDNDRTIECRYYEDIYASSKYINLHLSQEKFLGYFKYFLNRFEMKDEFTDKAVIHKFYDVDIDMIDELIEESRKFTNPKESDFKTFEFKKEKPLDIINIPDFDINYVKPRKVNRTNRFGKCVVMASAALLTTLSVFTVENMQSKKNNDVVNNKYIVEETINTDTENSGLYFDVENYEDKIENTLLPQEDIFIEEVSQEAPIVEVIEDEEEHENEVYVEKQVSNPDYYLVLNTTNEASGDKAYITEQYYGDVIKQVCKDYGLDYNVFRSVGTHERGIHSSVVDNGGGIGLYQIQIGGSYSWIGNTVNAYNFTTNQWDSVTITQENASDVFSNIKLGAMIFQECLRRNNYDVAKAVTEYNYGSTNLQIVLNKYKEAENPNYNNDPSDLNWLKYRSVISGGDPNYLENVFKYIENDSIITFYTPDGECINIKYENQNMVKMQ